VQLVFLIVTVCSGDDELVIMIRINQIEREMDIFIVSYIQYFYLFKIAIDGNHIRSFLLNFNRFYFDSIGNFSIL